MVKLLKVMPFLVFIFVFIFPLALTAPLSGVSSSSWPQGAQAQASTDSAKPQSTGAKAAKPVKATVKTATKSPAKGAGGGNGSGGAVGSSAPASPPSGPVSRTVSAKPLDDKDVAPTAPPPTSSPLAELKKSNDQLDKLLKKKYPNWSPEADAQKVAVQKLVGGFLDYRELAHRALARHWDKLQPAQRTEFVSTLRELVERSYLKQISGDPNYSIKYDKEEKRDSEATVDATLNTMARGKKVKIALVYKLVYKSHWLVYDVVTDEQSMLENYRAEFNKIINKDGFDTLLKRMKKKLEEKDE